MSDSKIATMSTTFRNVVRENFHKWDQNNDGFVSPKELKQASKSTRSHIGRAVADENQAALATLTEHVDEIQGLHDDEWFFENDGATRADISFLPSDPKLQNKVLTDFRNYLRNPQSMPLNKSTVRNLRRDLLK